MITEVIEGKTKDKTSNQNNREKKQLNKIFKYQKRKK